MVLLRLVTLAVAQSLDLITFTVMVERRGVVAEANPLVGDLFVAHGLAAVAALKILLVLLIGALVVAAWARGGRGVWMLVGAIPLTLAIAAGIFGGWTNAMAYLG